MHAAFPETNYISILPPSIDALRERIVKRGQDSEAQLAVRLKNAVGEIAEIIELENVIQQRIIN